jgi:hypothetical protein
MNDDARNIDPINGMPYATYDDGWSAAIDAVRASLADYPAAGGDTIIMAHVERLIEQGVQRVIKPSPSVLTAPCDAYIENTHSHGPDPRTMRQLWMAILNAPCDLE